MQEQIENKIMKPSIDAVNSELILTKVYGNSMYPTIKNGERVLVKKVLDSAIANAEHNAGADIDELKISRVFVDP